MHMKFNGSSSVFGPIPSRTIPTDPAFEAYLRLYGMIRHAAARHRMTPEFLLAMVMGEGVITMFLNFVPASPGEPLAWSDSELIDGAEYLGLDWIADELLDAGGSFMTVSGSVPDATGNNLHPDIGLQNLMDNGYVDGTRYNRDDLTGLYVFFNESRASLTDPDAKHYTATIRGWDAALEMVAATLNARLDQMLTVASRTRGELHEETLDFLSYARYNGDVFRGNWRTMAESLKEPRSAEPASPDQKYFDTSLHPRKWSLDTWPDLQVSIAADPSGIAGINRLWYVVLFRLVVANYLRAAEIYR